MNTNEIIWAIVIAVSVFFFLALIYALMVNSAQLDREAEANRINRKLAQDLKAMTKALNEPT